MVSPPALPDVTWQDIANTNDEMKRLHIDTKEAPKIKQGSNYRLRSTSQRERMLADPTANIDMNLNNDVMRPKGARSDLHPKKDADTKYQLRSTCLKLKTSAMRSA